MMNLKDILLKGRVGVWTMPVLDIRGIMRDV